MNCKKCNNEMIKGVFYGRTGMHWMPQEEYDKKGLKQLTRDRDSIVTIGRVECGNQIIDNMYYCPNCKTITGEIKANNK